LKMEPPLYANFIASIDYLESCNRSILNYAWVNIPLGKFGDGAWPAMVEHSTDITKKQGSNLAPGNRRENIAKLQLG
jgi:hypothetical protein